MKKIILLLIISFTAFSQENTTNEVDKKYTIENLIRTRDDLIKATENLTTAQWNFKESPERWSIAMVVEHLGNFELIWARELQEMSLNKPMPELNKTAYGDSVYHKFIMENKLHNSSTISQPNGYIKNKDNILWFTKLRNDNIKWTENVKVNLRDHFERTNTKEPRNMFNVYIYQWGHIDRHLRQINKVKAHVNYPK